MHARNAVAVCAISAATLAAHAGGPVSWADPADGIWGLASNWDPAVIPGASDDVLLGLVGAYTVTVANASRSAANLTIANPDATLNINAFRVLALFGGLSNEGLIVVNPAQTGASTILRFDMSAPISGSGRITLNNPTTTAVLAGGPGVVITHGANHTIGGVGQITGELLNNGLVVADRPGEELIVIGPQTNANLMRAVDAGVLRFDNAEVTQTGSAAIEADGPGSTLSFRNSTITGGEISASNDAIAAIAINSTFDGVTLNGPSRIDAFRILSVRNTLTHNGEMIVNPTATGASTILSLVDGADISGNGSILLNSNATTAQISSTGVGVSTHGANHSISGEGNISAALINNGSIFADRDGGVMQINGADKTNNGVMQAFAGGDLDLGPIVLTQGPGGLIIAEGPDSLVSLAGVRIVGGDILAGNGGVARVRLNSTVEDVRFEGQARVDAFRILDVVGTLENDGVITVNPTQTGAGTIVRLADGAQLAGSGQIVLDSNSTTASVSSVTNGSATQGADHSITGQGRIDARLTNNGLIEADRPGLTMELAVQTKTNNGLMRAVNGAVLAATGTTIEQSPGGRISADGPGSVFDLISSTVQGGSIETTGGGTVRLQASNGTLSGVALDADVEIFGFRVLTIGDGTTNDGSITVNPLATGAGTGIVFDSGFTLEGDGLIRLASNSTTAFINGSLGVVDAALGSGQRLEGIGRIQTPLAIHGTVAPGLDGVGTLNAISPVTLSGTSAFEAEVSGDQTSDRLASTSTFHADGTLEVTFVDGFNPPLSWSADIVTTGANGVTGAFNTVNAPQPADSRLEFRVVYETNRIRVGAFCRGDANSDGILNFFDISDFIADYNAGEPSADIAAPFGVLNFFDIVEFVARYNTGCP